MWGCLAASQRTVSRRKLWLIISEALRKRKGELVGSHDGLARLRRSENFHRYLLTFGLKHRQRSKGENIGAYVLAIFTVILEVFSFIHIRVSPTSKREFLRLIYFACQIMIGKVSRMSWPSILNVKWRGKSVRGRFCGLHGDGKRPWEPPL